MNQLLTTGIVLSRTDFGEADRIITVLTPDQGKLRLMAKGVRKVKSKLAGGIELFSISDITFLRGKGEIGTLISTRLETHYGNIVKDITRTQAGYDMIKLLNKVTEDSPEPEYFELMHGVFAALDDPAIDLELILLWFHAQLLKLAGHTPNLRTDVAGERLEVAKKYTFDYESMCFTKRDQGTFGSAHIKTMRLLFEGHSPAKLMQVQGIVGLLPIIEGTIRSLQNDHIRV